MLNGNLENAIATANRLPENGHQNPKLEKQRQQRLKERNRFVAMCKRMQTEGLIPYSPSLYTRDKNFTIETLSDRSFNIELNFRHLKCLALKFYACLDPERHAQFVQKLEKIEAPRLDVVLKMRNDLTIGYLYELPAYELRSHAPQRHKGSSTIKVAPGPDSLDHLFGGKTKNPYRQSLLFPVTTSQFEINSAQLTKYRVREQDATPAERLNNNMNLVDCSRALIRLIYQSSKYGNELAIFVNHPAFKILENEQGDSNGLPSTVYQVALTKAIEQKKVPIEKRKMPEFKTDEEAEQYFKERQKAMKEKLASILTTAHKQTVLGRRCIQTMKKLSGVEKAQNAKISVVRQHYNSLSNRSKNQFVKRYRMEKFNEATQFESDIRAEDNLKAPLVIPGFNPPDEKPESSLKLPSYVRNEILSPPKVQLSTADDIRSSIRGGKISRGRGGRRIRRGAKY
ncbi:hypothetical protein M3Y97_00806200 [Aphelenchoides bicaudatus]|nr:hypothetical protein M3Y97_00806200 [Aphelenchoides bicaudatus]